MPLSHNDIEPKTAPEVMREMLAESGVGESELSDMLGITRSALKNRMSDDAFNPQLKTLCETANCLGFDIWAIRRGDTVSDGSKLIKCGSGNIDSVDVEDHGNEPIYKPYKDRLIQTCPNCGSIMGNVEEHVVEQRNHVSAAFHMVFWLVMILIIGFSTSIGGPFLLLFEAPAFFIAIVAYIVYCAMNIECRVKIRKCSYCGFVVEEKD